MNILIEVSHWLPLGWVIVSTMLHSIKRRYGERTSEFKYYSLIRDVYHIGRILFWPSAIFNVVGWGYSHPSSMTANILYGLSCIYAWYRYKDIDKDDRWKKAKDKAVGVVKSLGHRLVVVNETPA